MSLVVIILAPLVKDGKASIFPQMRSSLALEVMKLSSDCQYLTMSFWNFICLHCRMDLGARLKGIIWVYRMSLDCGTLGKPCDWL